MRVLVGAAAIVSGIVLGVVVVGLIGGGDEPAEYAPFFAGLEDDLVDEIRRNGPVFYSDPLGGDKAVYLDLEDGDIVALHAVPPGETSTCPVGWDREAKRYVDCRRRPVDPATLNRFPVTTMTRDGQEGVLVDLREVRPAPGGAPPTPPPS